MRYCRHLVMLLLFPVILVLLGCSTGSSSGPQTVSKAQLLSVAQAELESVSTNPYMNPVDADEALRSAETNFGTVLAMDSTNTAAKFGLVLSFTYQGLIEMTEVLPPTVGSQITTLITSSAIGGTRARKSSALRLPAVQQRRTRSSSVQSAQLAIATSTLPGLTQNLSLLSSVETDVQNGATVQLRVYAGGQILTIVFGVSDVYLVDAFANLTASAMNLCICYNLDIPNGSAVTPAPISSDGVTLTPEEYLIPSPFLDSLVNTTTEGPAGFLEYLYTASGKAKLGTALTGHNMGNTELIDVTNSSVQQELNTLAGIAGEMTLAAQSQVSIGNVMGDGQSRTLNLPQLENISSLRAYMPTFPLNNPNAAGVWPDTTFGGIITPGIPQNYFVLTFQELEDAY